MFVHAEELTKYPEETMTKVWEYLGEDQFEHDFSNVEQYTIEHDIGYPYGDHVIRNTVKPLEKEWDAILGRQISQEIRRKFEWIVNDRRTIYR